jgi:hypothetical protein
MLLLNEDAEIQARIRKAKSIVSVSRQFLECCDTDIRVKYQVCTASPLNALLWGCETWNISKKNIKNFRVAITLSSGRILKMQVEPSQRTANKELMNKKPLLQYTKHQSIH